MNNPDDIKRLPIEAACAAKLKELRRSRGLTLEDCEITSGGKFKAVVLGSYERGSRAISLSKLTALADFYDVPIQYFFTSTKESTEGRWIFDLRKLRACEVTVFPFNFLTNSLTRIAELRCDWEGEILSIRNGDRESFEILFGNDREQLVKQLRESKIIIGNASGK